MALVSSIYRMAPDTPSWSQEETELRLKRAMRRVVERYGLTAVIDRIRAYPVRHDDEIRKAWLVLTAYAEERRGGRAGSF